MEKLGGGAMVPSVDKGTQIKLWGSVRFVTFKGYTSLQDLDERKSEREMWKELCVNVCGCVCVCVCVCARVRARARARARVCVCVCGWVGGWVGGCVDVYGLVGRWCAHARLSFFVCVFFFKQFHVMKVSYVNCW